MTALEAEYRYMLSRTTNPAERRSLVEHAMRYNIDLTDLL